MHQSYLETWRRRDRWPTYNKDHNGNCSLWAVPPADDSVVIPYWAFEALNNIILNMTDAQVEGRTGRHARHKQQYKSDLKDWHRYVRIKEAVAEHGNPWEGNAKGKPTVFQIVSKQLQGTAFAATGPGMRKAYERVTEALTQGEHHRYLRSRAYRYYDYLVNEPGPIVVVVGRDDGAVYVLSQK